MKAASPGAGSRRAAPTTTIPSLRRPPGWYPFHMPSTLIEVRRSYTPQQEIDIINAVHDSLVVAFKIPQDDRYIRLATFEPHRMVNGLEEGQPDGYTRVTIDC